MERLSSGVDVCERVQSVTTFSLSLDDRQRYPLIVMQSSALQTRSTKAEGKLALNLLWG